MRHYSYKGRKNPLATISSVDFDKYREKVENLAAQFMGDGKIAHELGITQSSVNRIRTEFDIEAGALRKNAYYKKLLSKTWNETKSVKAVHDVSGCKAISHTITRLKHLHSEGVIDFSSYRATSKQIKKAETPTKPHERTYEETLLAREKLAKLAVKAVLNKSFIPYINKVRIERGALPYAVSGM